MIWATVSSRSCLCWLYRASPSSAAKNIINLISVLTIWSCPRRESSCMLLEKGACYVQHVLLTKLLLACVLLHFVFQGQTCLSFQVSLDFLLLYSNPLWWIKDIFFGVSPTNFSFFALVVGAQTWITVMLNDLPWTRTEIILPFLRLHPSTAFQLLLLTMRATPFLLRDSCLL